MTLYIVGYTSFVHQIFKQAHDLKRIQKSPQVDGKNMRMCIRN